MNTESSFWFLKINLQKKYEKGKQYFKGQI